MPISNWERKRGELGPEEQGIEKAWEAKNRPLVAVRTQIHSALGEGDYILFSSASMKSTND